LKHDRINNQKEHVMNQQRMASMASSEKDKSCRQCASYLLCRPGGDSGPNLKSRRYTLGKGSHLFRSGDAFRSIYIIHSGCIKISMLSGAGDAQVLRFALPGELVGMNAVGNLHYPSDAVALEPTELCELPFAQLEKLTQTFPALQHQLLRLLSDEIVMDEKLMATLGRQKAETRLANCLLNFHQRFQLQENTGLSFRLPMSRQDIGDYLGLSLETISRLLSRLQADGLVRVRGRQVHLIDLQRLQSLAEHCPELIATRA
jgi:CRP/FNR family transcriptional regulator, anaerobic regulatory protein